MSPLFIHAVPTPWNVLSYHCLLPTSSSAFKIWSNVTSSRKSSLHFHKMELINPFSHGTIFIVVGDFFGVFLAAPRHVEFLDQESDPSLSCNLCHS